MNAFAYAGPVSPLVCTVCRRADCELASHSGPDRDFRRLQDLEEEDRQRIEARDAQARAARDAIGLERALVSQVRRTIAKLPVGDMTVEARAQALLALDALWDAFTVERQARIAAGTLETGLPL